MTISCPFCSKEFEKRDKHVQRCPFCGFFFDPNKNMKSMKEEIHEEMKKATLIPIEKVREESKKYQYTVKKKPMKPTQYRASSYTICLTGKLQSMTRKEAQNLLERNGHTFRTSVSKNLDFLVLAGTRIPLSTKHRTAKAYNIPILDEKEFLEMMA